MTSLSQAIRTGCTRAPRESQRGYFAGENSADVLGAAMLGQVSETALPHVLTRLRTSSHESLCQYMIHELHRAWPDLGRSVRAWPKFAEELERDRLIPRLRPNQTTYRQEIHVSLWTVLTKMQVVGEAREAIADTLARHGL
jgi:hypothetical protein